MEANQCVVIIGTMAVSHLNRSIAIAKNLQSLGYEVYYAGSVRLVPFVVKNQFKLYPLSSKAIPLSKQNDRKATITAFKDDTFIEKRKAELDKLMATLQPSVVFLSQFCVGDFVFLHKHQLTCRIVLLQTKFPMYPSIEIPPSNRFLFPNQWVRGYWWVEGIKQKWKQLRQTIFYQGHTAQAQLKKAIQSVALPAHYRLNTKKLYSPSFDNLEEWFLVPSELDFKEQNLQPWQRYVGLPAATNRKEIVRSAFKNFVAAQQSIPNSRLIYVSLGTVTKIHLKKNQNADKTFYQKVEKIANKHPHWFFVVAQGDEFQKENLTDLRTPNLLFTTFAPQVFILKNASLFITHGGVSSILEAVSLAIPMLLLPLNNKYEQPGNAARMVYHGLGEKIGFGISPQELLEKVDAILQNNTMKQNLLQYQQKLNAKYTDDYLKNIIKKLLIHLKC